MTSNRSGGGNLDVEVKLLGCRPDRDRQWQTGRWGRKRAKVYGHCDARDLHGKATGVREVVHDRHSCTGIRGAPRSNLVLNSTGTLSLNTVSYSAYHHETS